MAGSDARGEVIGGPADGLRLPLVGAWRWVDPARGMGFRARGPGRALYKRLGRSWEFCGWDAGLCDGCGVFLMSCAVFCPLCGLVKGGSNG
jgi:hypothetical protein